jgi:hypothetical protein
VHGCVKKPKRYRIFMPVQVCYVAMRISCVYSFKNRKAQATSYKVCGCVSEYFKCGFCSVLRYLVLQRHRNHIASGDSACFMPSTPRSPPVQFTLSPEHSLFKSLKILAETPDATTWPKGNPVQQALKAVALTFFSQPHALPYPASDPAYFYKFP